ncbi:uncharacterized protein B0H18DRAFT_994746 [Fomitopsis serialis]|uniref:uncharacterized protein n=1 Tax=Fomitopsis serialis TaxID=139415 RepID=UPI0020075AD2|nr:uncharacterized protein B0H18DRAFT_994746 [Neoantrodia serialis]KAH9929995.1 hypothetical protein B0H18DRAFT_994746 [Neoantrodia serialis]
MSLLSSSETLSFNAFLASVDHTHIAEISPDLAEQISISKGRHALAKATKDLMSLGNRAHGNSKTRSGASGRAAGAGLGSGAAAGPSHWPSFSPDSNGGDARSPRSFDLSKSMMQPEPGAYTTHPHSQSQPSIHSLTSGSPPYTLPPLNGDLPPTNGFDTPHRNALISSPSAPSTLGHPAGSSSKRSLPDDSEPSSSKRAKPAAPREKQRRQSSASASSASKAAKPALLTPAEKRANHIQSEQKRRANIRRGYEALCAAVPALREAIAQEEANGGGEAESSAKGRKRRKKGEDSALDGRAGPKSENVVLQKTIDHIHLLLSDREALFSRLQAARQALGEGHPALVLNTELRDISGVPLWEREWNGGTGTDDGADDDDGDDFGGSEPEA